MKLLYILLCFFFLHAFISGQNFPNLIELERRLPSSSKVADYTRDRIEERKRIGNILLQKVSPTETEKEKFKTFLAQPKTGIVRLLKKKECPETFPQRTEDWLEYAKKCPTSYIVGGGANFSFRRKKYVSDKQSDITFENGLVFSNGLLNHSIMVNLNNTSIENVSLETPELEFLKSFIPATDIYEADKQKFSIESGIENNGFLYARGFKIVENSTFALRVTAYKADLKTDKNLGGMNITFDPFYEDLREDILIVFKVFNINDDGATLVWRELQRKKSPALKFEK